MSTDDIMNSYESVSQAETVSYKDWYFTNGSIIVKRECRDVRFLIKLLESTSPSTHKWSMVPNYYNTKVLPFLPYADYITLSGANPNVFRFTNIRNVTMSKAVKVGDYMVWPEISATYVGWALYLYLNTGYKLKPLIPLCHHERFGSVNLLTDSDQNLDVSCKILQEDKILFTNTDHNPTTEVFRLVMAEQNGEQLRAVFGKEYVYSNSRIWLEFLVNNERVDKCEFVNEFHFVCDTIDLRKLRWLGDRVAISRIETPAAVDVVKSVDRLSPCSVFEVELESTIQNCLKTMEELMTTKCPATLDFDGDVLKFYLKHSDYSTFYILLISVWQYCESVINMHNQYTIEDILFYVKRMCEGVGGGHTLFIDNLMYFSSKNTAKNFMSSLYFFVNPEQGIEEFFDAISSYYVLHLCIYQKTEKWIVTNCTVAIADVDINIKSVGFFKKIKVGKFDYIFNGHTYENYKNRKEHSLASIYERCPEVTVPSLLFNKTLNFYMTQEGLFDVCRKEYKQPCPFIVMSTLKKNYISKNQSYLDKKLFNKLYNSIDRDLTLLKVYHARKFLDDFRVVKQNLADCVLLGDKMNEVRFDLEYRWREMVNWLLEYKASDLLILAMRMRDSLSQPINNILSLPVNVDVMGLQVAIVCHLLWPKSKTDTFFWSLLCTTYQDFEDWLEGYDYSGLLSEDVFKNKKKITEGMHRHLYKIRFEDAESIENLKLIVQNAGAPDDKRYEVRRIVKNIGADYKKYEKIPTEYNVWSDLLIEHRRNENMYVWLTRFYLRMFLNDYQGSDLNMLMSVVEGFSYFRVFTNFHTNNSKALINFCASLAIPVDNEKMCIVLSSKPNCGKSSLWELLSKIILVYKQDKEEYRHNKNEKDEKVKMYECQLYVMNEAQRFSKAFLKSIVDSTRIDSARCNYGVMENFNITFKALVCNNEDDKIFVTDGYDKACSNRIGQMYFDHHFDPELRRFGGSVYENHVKKRYCEMRDINTKLIPSVKEFLANVLKHNCHPDDGQLYYKSILQNDNSYKHNKKCLYVYNNRLEALLYVMDVKECKNAIEFTEESLLDRIKCAEKYVTQMVHYSRRNGVCLDSLCADFKRKYNNPRFYNAEAKTYSNLSIAPDEKRFRQYSPRFKANVDDCL